jgi:hypothetical protein
MRDLEAVAEVKSTILISSLRLHLEIFRGIKLKWLKYWHSNSMVK